MYLELSALVDDPASGHHGVILSPPLNPRLGVEIGNNVWVINMSFIGFNRLCVQILTCTNSSPPAPYF